MPIMEWNSHLVTGQPQIDHDHKILVNLINKLADAMKGSKAKEIIGGVLNELLSYTKTHFTMEEGLMKTYGYKDAAAHHKLHGDFIHNVLAFKEKFDSGMSINSVALLYMLRDWLSQHIQKSDKEFVATIPGLAKPATATA